MLKKSAPLIYQTRGTKHKHNNLSSNQQMNAKIPKKFIGQTFTATGLALAGIALYNSFYTVEAGHKAVMFDRLKGVLNKTYGEGLHFRVPWLQKPVIMDVRTRPKQLSSPTGTRDLQTVNISLRILYRPDADVLPRIYALYGLDYDARVLPSIVNEALKSVVAQFTAAQITTQREEVSKLIRRNLLDKADLFSIKIEDVSITHLSFTAEYAQAVEEKQIAQQEAARARYLVEQAEQEKRSVIIKAIGEARSVELVGEAVKKNPGFLELRRLEAAREISAGLAESKNKVFLDSKGLLLNTDGFRDVVMSG